MEMPGQKHNKKLEDEDKIKGSKTSKETGEQGEKDVEKKREREKGEDA